MRSHFGTIETLPSSRHRGRYRRQNRTYYTPTRPRKTQVKADLTRIHATILDGTWQPHTRAQPTFVAGTWAADLTLQDWYDHWYEDLEKSSASPNSLRAHRSLFRCHILPTLGELYISDITPDHCTELFNKAQGKLARVSAQNVIRSLSTCMTAAVDAKIIPSNPVKVKGAMGKPPRSHSFQMLETADITALLDATEDRFRLGIALGVWCQLRIGEIPPLERADISTETWEVTVSKTLRRGPSGKLTLGPPKSHAGYRTISIPDVMHNIVTYHLETFVAPSRDAGLYVNTASRDGWFSDRAFRSALHAAADKAGIARPRFHDLRHIGLTHYGRAGATTADLMHRAGHANPETVAIYQHSTRQRDRELASKLGRTA